MGENRLFIIFIVFIAIITSIFIVYKYKADIEEPFAIIGTIGTQNLGSEAARLASMIADARSIPMDKIQEIVSEKKVQKEREDKEKEAKAKEEKQKQEREAATLQQTLAENEADKSRPYSYLETLLSDLNVDFDITPEISAYHTNTYTVRFFRNNAYNICILADETQTAAKYTAYQLKFKPMSQDVIANKIVKAFQAKEDVKASLSLSIDRFYTNMLDKNADQFKAFAYQECAEFITKWRRIKQEMNDTNDIRSQVSKLTTAEKNRFNTIITKFYDSYIYANINNSDNPLNTIDINYGIYIDSVINKNRNYSVIIPEITRNLKNSKIYNDNNVFKKNILNHLEIHTKNITYLFQGILNAVKEDGSCFQENIGELEVDMRPCTLHFTDYYESCEKFGELYKLSPMQLQNLINKNTEVFKSILIKNIPYPIYIYDTLFIALIELYDRLNVLQYLQESPEKMKYIHIEHFREALKRQCDINILHSQNLLKQIESSIDTLCKKIWVDIFKLKVSYKKKQYNCFDIAIVRKRKLEDPNIQLCKITFSDELKEIHKVHGDDKEYERKLYNYKYSNKSDLWGACFYSVKAGENPDKIMSNYRKNYSLTSLCPEKPVLTNIKCKNGCASNNEDKFIPFHVEPVGNDISPYIMNPRLNIPANAIFMKIAFRNYKFKPDEIRGKNYVWLNKQMFSIDITFVKFNNQTKEFYIFEDRNAINSIMKNQLFTIRVNAEEVYLSPNNSQKQVYVCSFYNKKVYEYSVLPLNVSLTDFRVQNVSLKSMSPSADIYTKIIENRYSLRCNDWENMTNVISCINTLKNTLNTNLINSWKYELHDQKIKQGQQQAAKQNNINILSAKQAALNNEIKSTALCDANNPIFPTFSFWIKTGNDMIAQKQRLLDIENNYKTGLRSEERNIQYNLNNRRLGLFEIIYWEIQKKANQDKQWFATQKINQLEKEIQAQKIIIAPFEDKCRTINQNKIAIENEVRNINNEIASNNVEINNYNAKINRLNTQINDLASGRGANALQNVESYHINSYDFYKNIYERIKKQELLVSVLDKYLYSENVYLSNDDAIYINVA